MEKFRNKYRIQSASLPNWDYAWNAAYFVTICTVNRECCFGEIVNSEMVLSEIGKLIAPEWLKTIELRPDMNLEIDEYVVMPNHFHAIIKIGENQYNTQRETNRRVDTQCIASLPPISPKFRDIKTISGRNQKIWHPLFADLNPLLQ